MSIKIKPIGIVHSAYKTADEAPRGWARLKKPAQIEIYPDYEEGLTDIEGFSHILVIYGFDQSKGYHLMANTPWDNVPHGVFASRSPNRPNPIGVCLVRLIDRNGRFLNIEGIDALEGSPILDIKPYVPGLDEAVGIRLGWLEKSPGFKSQRKKEQQF